jgi:hypothetical protein
VPQLVGFGVTTLLEKGASITIATTRQTHFHNATKKKKESNITAKKITPNKLTNAAKNCLFCY